MASSVFYKFKSQKSDSRVTFDGTGISIFDLKKEIILANNLGKANDFDILVSDSSTGDEFKDDAHVLPRSSSVVVRRIPVSRGSKGASRYLSGAGPAASGPEASNKQEGNASQPNWYRNQMSKRFDGREDPKAKAPAKEVVVPSSVANDDEAAAMAAMFQAQTASWEETQEKMSHATYIHRAPRGGGSDRGGRPQSSAQPYRPADRPLPPSYVCYRCGNKGHWIQDCPTNNDRDFDNRPRIKRTTGIPRSFLKTVENPNSGANGQSVMVTPEGGFVVAEPDIASWQKQVTKSKVVTEADIRERTPTDASLICSIDNKLFRDAVQTPCCGTTFCEECIQTHLLERDFVCPHCKRKVLSLDKLTPDQSMRTKVGEYIAKAIDDSKKEGDEPSISAPGNSTPSDGLPALQGDALASAGETENPETDIPQLIADSVPQLQAQLAQLTNMLQNPSLPKAVRASTELQHQQLQMQLQHAQTIAAAVAVNSAFQQQQQQQQPQQSQQQQGGQQQPDFSSMVNPMQGMPFMDPMATAMMQGAWPGPSGSEGMMNPYNGGAQGQMGPESAYQRLPVNNRRRNLKRERPSDFLEVAGAEGDGRYPRYWE